MGGIVFPFPLSLPLQARPQWPLLVVSLRLYQVGIEVSGQQELGSVRLIPDGRSNVLYGQGIAGGDKTPNDIPPPPPRHQMEADDV